MKKGRFAHKYGPWALITGASAGLGAALAERLAAEGLHLVLTARREERLRALADRLSEAYGVNTRVIACDLAEPEGASAILEQTNDIEIGLLVNNAGFSRTGPLTESAVEAERRMYRVNCEAPLLLSMEYGKLMKERGRGGIIFVSSSVALSPVPYWTHYAATKAYTMFLGEGMHYELKTYGVDVLALCPGGMKTEFQDVAGISGLGAMDVKPVAEAAVKQLGRKPSVIPGLLMAAAFRTFARILPKRLSLSMYALMMTKLSHKTHKA